MRTSYQSKHQNMSTSDSDYFRQRFINSDSKINGSHQMSPPSISSGMKSKLTTSEQKIMYPPLYSTTTSNYEQSYGLMKPQLQIKKKSLYNNPFLQTTYDNNPSVRTKKRKSAQQQTNNYGYGYGYVNAEKPQQQQQAQRQPSQRHYYIDNNNNHKSNNNNSKLIEPITQIKASKSQDIIKAPYHYNNHSSNSKTPSTHHKLNPNSNFNNLQNRNNNINQPHNKLDHIHFTLSNKSIILKVFKQFTQNEKQHINERFSQLKRQLQNTLQQVRYKLSEQIDSQYEQMIKQMNTLRDMAQRVWENKSNIDKEKGSSKSKRHSNYDSNRSRNGSINKSILNNKHFNSNNNNSNLIQQLHLQDKQLQQYLQTKNKYFGSNSNNIQQYNQQQLNSNKSNNLLLTKMFDCSIRIASKMRQCRREIDDNDDNKNGCLITNNKISDDNKNNNRMRYSKWVDCYDNNINNKYNYGSQLQSSSSYQEFQIHQYTNKQLQQLTLMVNHFRQLLMQRSACCYKLSSNQQ